MTRLACGVGTALALALLQGWAASRVAGQEADLEGIGVVVGDPSAHITVVEYADFACSACGAFAVGTWPPIRRKYVETGQVRWRVVVFELGFRNSEKGARAGQCAARQDRFWDMHEALFVRQDEWVNERKAQDHLRVIAAEVGLDMDAFRRCFDDDEAEEDRKAANRAARTDAVRGTPTFFINGFRVQGALPQEAFEALLVPPTGRR